MSTAVPPGTAGRCEAQACSPETGRKDGRAAGRRAGSVRVRLLPTPIRPRLSFRRRAGYRGHMHSFQLYWRAAIALPAFAILLPTASAQATPTELPHAVITPARIEQSIDDALPATTVITRADIERW